MVMVASAISWLARFSLISTNDQSGFLVLERPVPFGRRIRMGDLLPPLLQKVVRVRGQVGDLHALVVPAFPILPLRTKNVAEFLKAPHRVARPILVLGRARLKNAEWIVIRSTTGSTACRCARKDDHAVFRLTLQGGNDGSGDRAGDLLSHARRHRRQERTRRRPRGAHLLRHGRQIAASYGGLQPVRLRAHAVPQRPALQPGLVIASRAGRVRQGVPHRRRHAPGLFGQGSRHDLLNPQPLQALAQF